MQNSSWRRKAAWGAGALAAILIALALALPALIDTEKFKSLATERIRQTLGRELTIESLSVRIFPLPALRATNVTLANAAWAQEPFLLQAASIDARLDLASILTGKVAIDRLALDRVKVAPEIAVDGRKSWSFSGAAPAASTGDPAAFDPTRLKAIRVSEGSIVYRKGKAEAAVWQVETFQARSGSGWRDVSLDTRLVRNGHPLEIAAEFADLSRIGLADAVTDGTLRLAWADAVLSLKGRLPLDAALRGQAVLEFEASSLKGFLGFFGTSSPGTAAVRASGNLSETKGGMKLDDLRLSLGKLALTGDATLILSGTVPAFDARVNIPSLNWAEASRDAGRPEPAPPPQGQLFRSNPYAWPLLAAMDGWQGKLDLKLGALKLRSGVQATDLTARMVQKGDQLDIQAFSFRALGGSAKGKLLLDASQSSARLDFNGEGLQLGQWLSQRGKKLALAGGPMNIVAQVSARGASMKDLAASLTGPVTIRMGPATIDSREVDKAEALMVGLLPMMSARDSSKVTVACVGARLPFSKGRAVAEPIVGLRSDVSQMLAAGSIDLARQTMDLRGRLKASSGISLGVSTLAGDIRIAGALAKPEIGLDPAGTPTALAKFGAAIATGGVSLLAGVLWDAATVGDDPCQMVFASGANAKK